MVKLRIRGRRAGHARTRVKIFTQDPTAAANDDGEIPETPKEVGRRWATVIPRRGQVELLPGTREANVHYWVRVPYDNLTKALDPNYWLETVDTGQRLNIGGALDIDSRHRLIELECTERLS